MLTVTLASWLLAAAATPVEAQLELSPESDGRLALRLCFSSPQPRQLAYRLEVKSTGAAGTSRTRQSGELVSNSAGQCPINNRLSLSPNGRIEATLDWSIDGQAQPTIHQSYPATQPASPAPQPQTPHPSERLHDVERQVATSRTSKNSATR